MPALARFARRLLAIVICLCGLGLGARAGAREVPAPESAPSEVRRFALLVGANDGGRERVKLRYAHSDADAVGDVLRSIGGVQPSDLIELRDPTRVELDAAFIEMTTKLRAAAALGVRTQLLFYYSGHSDEKGLLLGSERLEYAGLRKRVQAVPADVRIAILDSCASGAFTRAKGGKKRPPFLVGSAASVAGHAFLTSSSADEAAQESDRVGGSFFTHFFTTGLRGAADVDGDRYVTLTEAYRFAFEETLARTESTRGGAQHAAYDIQLAGSGDLVMTDLRKPSATLVLGADVVGRISVRRVGGPLAAELYKPAGSLALAIEPGAYQILLDDGKQRRRADVEIARRGRAQVQAADFRVVPLEVAALRGDEEYLEVPFDIGLLPPASINGTAARRQKLKDPRIRNRASLSFGWNRAARVDGVSLGFAASIVDEELHGAQGSLGVAIVRGHVEGWQFGQLFNHAGSLHGAQTGLFNNVGELRRGTQLGLVNVGGEVDGVQVGLVTYAKRAKAAVGLLTITREGSVHPEVWTSDVAAFQLGLRFPAKYTYSMITMGVHPFGDGKSWIFGGGWGGHAPLGKRGAFMDIDIGGAVVLQGMRVNKKPGGLGQLRLLFGWQPFDRLSIFGGPTLSVFAHRTQDDLARPGYPWTVYDSGTDDDVRVRLWPGFAAGLRF